MSRSESLVLLKVSSSRNSLDEGGGERGDTMLLSSRTVRLGERPVSPLNVRRVGGDGDLSLRTVDAADVVQRLTTGTGEMLVVLPRPLVFKRASTSTLSRPTVQKQCSETSEGLDDILGGLRL